MSPCCLFLVKYLVLWIWQTSASLRTPPLRPQTRKTGCSRSAPRRCTCSLWSRSGETLSERWNRGNTTLHSQAFICLSPSSCLIWFSGNVNSGPGTGWLRFGIGVYWVLSEGCALCLQREEDDVATAGPTAGVYSKTGAAGNSQTEADCQETISAFRSDQAQTGWLVPSAGVKLGADKSEKRRGLLQRDINCHSSSQLKITLRPRALLEMTALAPRKDMTAKFPRDSSGEPKSRVICFNSDSLWIRASLI